MDPGKFVFEQLMDFVARSLPGFGDFSKSIDSADPDPLGISDWFNRSAESAH
jgi:hypothetical protein